jgi:hypothetical protein
MNTALINLTDTMLKKSIIDANKSVCEFAKRFSFNYNEAECGERKPLKASYPDGTQAKVTFYRAKTRGDKRISITKLKKFAKAGDNVTLINTDDDERIKILINVTVGK